MFNIHTNILYKNVFINQSQVLGKLDTCISFADIYISYKSRLK